ncbi:hypothetical protein MACH09_06150 [Vibrio sp. MACH09]|nr:hypothetical protein MACH09_06150 [Vibrio sp. MACH09]
MRSTIDIAPKSTDGFNSLKKTLIRSAFTYIKVSGLFNYQDQALASQRLILICYVYNFTSLNLVVSTTTSNSTD